jgi:diguanylate cyclase (GGDEF)-like protein
VDAAEGTVGRPDEEITVLVHRRDLADDPTVRGIVTTLRDVTAERAMKRDLAYRANHDELTGLANGRLFGRTLDEEHERRVSRGEGTAVLFVDLDDFKSVNDSYGHEAGDRVLAEVARRIHGAIRAGDVAARVGGDEFAVLLRGVPNVDDARAVAERIAQTLSRPADVEGEPVDCGASIGLAYTERRERVDGLTSEADAALYVAKANGKGQWREYVAGMPDRRPPRRRPPAEARRHR